MVILKIMFCQFPKLDYIHEKQGNKQKYYALNYN